MSLSGVMFPERCMWEALPWFMKNWKSIHILHITLFLIAVTVIWYSQRYMLWSMKELKSILASHSNLGFFLLSQNINLEEMKKIYIEPNLVDIYWNHVIDNLTLSNKNSKKNLQTILFLDSFIINNVFGIAKKINDSFSHVQSLKKIIICTFQITAILYLFNFIKSSKLLLTTIEQLIFKR